ncbi:UNVERIFIED_CONTAM: hypothetical protein HDU68_003801 [Siphonaria sp. JEL0065]|nr:hypothetical protein HDU68_003801 [Siphonaria sp. JEL0065]
MRRAVNELVPALTGDGLGGLDDARNDWAADMAVVLAELEKSTDPLPGDHLLLAQLVCALPLQLANLCTELTPRGSSVSLALVDLDLHGLVHSQLVLPANEMYMPDIDYSHNYYNLLTCLGNMVGRLSVALLNTPHDLVENEDEITTTSAFLKQTFASLTTHNRFPSISKPGPLVEDYVWSHSWGIFMGGWFQKCNAQASDDTLVSNNTLVCLLIALATTEEYNEEEEDDEKYAIPLQVVDWNVVAALSVVSRRLTSPQPSCPPLSIKPLPQIAAPCHWHKLPTFHLPVSSALHSSTKWKPFLTMFPGIYT